MSDGRFQPKFSDNELLAVMREVVRGCAGEHVSQRAYDNAREQVGRADTPKSSRLVTRLKLTWPRLVELAREDAESASHIVALARRHDPAARDDARIINALQTASRRRGTATLSQHEYERERQAIIAANKRAHRHGSDVASLYPTALNIESACGSWERACVLAGLTAATPRERRSQIQPVRASDYTWNIVIGEFIACYGFQPVHREAEEFAAKRGITIKQYKGRPWQEWLTKAREDASRAGRFFPARLVPSAQPLGWREWPNTPPDHDPGQRPLPPRRGRDHGITTAEALDALRRAVELMPAGRDLTQRAYNDLRRQHRELPSYTSLQRVAMREGGLHAGDLVRQVIAERAQR